MSFIFINCFFCYFNSFSCLVCLWNFSVQSFKLLDDIYNCFDKIFSVAQADSLWFLISFNCFYKSAACFFSLIFVAVVESQRILAFDILALKLLRTILSCIFDYYQIFLALCQWINYQQNQSVYIQSETFSKLILQASLVFNYLISKIFLLQQKLIIKQFLSFINKNHPINCEYLKQNQRALKQMQINIKQLDFTIAINSLSDQVMHKMEVLTNMQIELLRKFQNQISNSQSHFEMIHEVRMMLVNLEQIYKDVKEYFTQINSGFLYDFFRKIHVLMICGYNFLSQALLVNIDKLQGRGAVNAIGNDGFMSCKKCKCTCQSSNVNTSSKNKRRQLKDVQQFDFKISMLENEQQKLSNEIHNLHDKMMNQKALIEKTKPSLVIRQLEDMKQHVQNIMESTNSIFEETYMMKYVQFKNYLTQIKKPDDMVKFFINNMGNNMREKFMSGMNRAIHKAQELQLHLDKKELQQQCTQTDKTGKDMNKTMFSQTSSSAYKGLLLGKSHEKGSTALSKQRKGNEKLITELQYLKKMVNSITMEKQNLKIQLSKATQQANKYKVDFQTLENLYGKRSYQLEIVQNEKQWINNEKQCETKKLKSEIKQLRKSQSQTSSVAIQAFIPTSCESVSTETQINNFQNQIDNEIIKVLKTNNEKMIRCLNDKEKKNKQLHLSLLQSADLKQIKTISCQFFTSMVDFLSKFDLQMSKHKVNIESKGIKQNMNLSYIDEITKLISVKVTQLIPLNISPRSIDKRNSTIRRSTKKSSINQAFSENDAVQTKKLKTQQSQSRFRQSKHKNQLNKENQTINFKKSSINTLKSSMSSIDSEDIINQSTHQMSKSGRNSNQRGSLFSNNNNKYKMKVRLSSLENQHYSVEFGIQTDTFKLKKSTSKNSKHSKDKKTTEQDQQAFTQLCEIDIQTQPIQLHHLLPQSLIENIKLNQSYANNSNNPKFQSFTNDSKKPYIKKPAIGRLTMDRNPNSMTNSQRDYISVNNHEPMTDFQITQLIRSSIRKQSQMQKSHDRSSETQGHSKFISQNGRASNATLESRLSLLTGGFNSKRQSRVSNLIVFKKPSNGYEKRSSQMVFDEINIGKQEQSSNNNFPKHNVQRNASFNSYNPNNCNTSRPPHNTVKQSKFKQMISRMSTQDVKTSFQRIQEQKQNFKLPVSHSNQNKKAFQNIIQEEQFGLNQPLSKQKQRQNFQDDSIMLKVAKKTPIHRSPTKSARQSPRQKFDNSVKLMLSVQSKQQLIRKIQNIYRDLQREKQKKFAMKNNNMKKVSTPRSSMKRQKIDDKNQLTLGSILN